MNKRQFLKGMAATAAGILIPSHVLSGQYEFHQRVSGLLSSSNASDASSGNGSLLYGDSNLGYYGFVSASDFITGDALASAIGFTAGNSQYSDEGWFKYSFEGKTRFVAKKALRNNVTWPDIYKVGAVYGSFDAGFAPSGPAVTQNATVRIDGVDYVVKLMRGSTVFTPATGSSGTWDAVHTHGSEWNQVFYRLHSGSHTDIRNNLSNETSKADFESWGNYSDADLGVHMDFGLGSFSWCQEGTTNFSNQRMGRGAYGISHTNLGWLSTVALSTGWRPVLEELS